MDWRIHASVIRGELDNRKRGWVTGRLWLAERAEPIILKLRGNAWRDLAGCRLVFSNPFFKAGEPVPLAPLQHGVVGDLTASLKARVPSVSPEEFRRLLEEDRPIPYTWGNCLHLEWFSRKNGRVVIEAADYFCRVSEPEWQMSQKEEDRQKRRNGQALERYSKALAADAERDVHVEPEPADDGVMDEFVWERLLRESDRRTARLMDLMERFRDDPDREQRIAREMAWHPPPGWWGRRAGSADPEKAFEEAVSTDPLYLRAFRLAWRFEREAAQSGCFGGRGEADAEISRTLDGLIGVAARIAGALEGAGGSGAPPAGFVVASLKRSLALLHGAIGGLDGVQREGAAAAIWLQRLRMEMLTLREEIHMRMQEYRGKSRGGD